MLNDLSKKVVVFVLLIGLVSLVLGGFFVYQGFAKANYLTEAMVSQNITYGSAGGTITGIIDTPQEAQAMADILQEHSKALGNYVQLKRDDPNRQTILNGMTMINSMELAVMGYGLTDVVKASGAFMILIGATFGVLGISVLRKGKQEAK